LREDLGRSLSDLALPGKTLVPDYVTEALREHRSVPLNLDIFSKTKRLATAAASRRLGWIDFGLYEAERQEITNYYWYYRNLDFERFKIEVRNEILATINRALSRIAKNTGIILHLALVGFPDIKDYQVARARIESGDGTLEEIFEPFSRFR
jgi:hypothetical protein